MVTLLCRQPENFVNHYPWCVMLTDASSLHSVRFACSNCNAWRLSLAVDVRIFVIVRNVFFFLSSILFSLLPIQPRAFSILAVATSSPSGTDEWMCSGELIYDLRSRSLFDKILVLLMREVWLWKSDIFFPHFIYLFLKREGELRVLILYFTQLLWLKTKLEPLNSEMIYVVIWKKLKLNGFMHWACEKWENK